jgi:hypothetical protein
MLAKNCLFLKSNPMSENAPETVGAGWRLKKSEEGTIFGPVEASVLKEWADVAQVGPEDEVDQGDDAWQPAPEVAFLEMVWEVTLESGRPYGPTTWGTLTEFLKEGLVSPQTLAVNMITKEARPLSAIVIDQIKEVYPEQPESSGPGGNLATANQMAPESPSRSGLIMIEIAKDQHIRQLEEDLRTLKKQYDELLREYQVLNQEVTDLRARTKTGKSELF